MLYLLLLVTSALRGMRGGLSRSGQAGVGSPSWPTDTGLSRHNFAKLREIEAS